MNYKNKNYSPRKTPNTTTTSTVYAQPPRGRFDTEFNYAHQWSHGLFSCCEDFKFACGVLCCPCFNWCAIDKAVGVRDDIYFK